MISTISLVSSCPCLWLSFSHCPSSCWLPPSSSPNRADRPPQDAAERSQCHIHTAPAPTHSSGQDPSAPTAHGSWWMTHPSESPPAVASGRYPPCWIPDARTGTCHDMIPWPCIHRRAAGIPSAPRWQTYRSAPSPRRSGPTSTAMISPR